jgi:hypothetical protein
MILVHQLQLIFCRKLYQYYIWFVVRTMKPICCLQHFYFPFLFFLRIGEIIIKVVEFTIWSVFEDWIVTFRLFPSNLISEILIAWLSEAFPVSVISPIPATAKSYISGISYKIKINNLEDRTQSFILKKMLQGMQRLDKKKDSRKPIPCNTHTFAFIFR